MLGSKPAPAQAGGNRCRDLVLALVVNRILDPGSKLAAARALPPETASSSLGEQLALGAVDEDELYTALDRLAVRRPAIEAALAKRHFSGGTLYDVSSSCLEGRCCPLARFGYSRDGKHGRRQIVDGLLCAAKPALAKAGGCPVAIEVFAGSTADPATLTSQVAKLKQRFGLDHVVLVVGLQPTGLTRGGRGMITQARISDDLKAAGLDWITALRAPAIKALREAGTLQMPLFDERDPGSRVEGVPGQDRDMAAITSSDFPGERLIVCRNRALAPTGRARGLKAHERARKRQPRRGKAEIGLEVGAVLDRHKMARHFALDITDTRFGFSRKTDAIAAEAALDGICVVRTSLPAAALDDAATVKSYKS
ncbi:MAG: IS1634 family transposase, partial [Steroidobacteraceae bacterium]